MSVTRVGGTLSEDLGRTLGTVAHLAALRRLWVEPFEGARLWTLEDLHGAAERERLDEALLSPDAGLFGNRLGVNEAYRFARGEEVTTSTGQPARLARPLDWLAVTDHSDMMGFATDLFDGASAIVDTEQGRGWYEAMQKGGDAAAKAEVKLTFMPFLMKAVCKAMAEFPQFNSALSPDGERLILKKYMHIGIAVDTPNGLVVPVVRDVDRKGIFDLAADLGEISAKARAGKLAPDDMQGGCLSISSLGGIGGTQFAPIVNAPEVAILGISRAVMQPKWDGQAFAPRLMMPFSLSYDHRVIDGAEGVRFTTYLGLLLEDIRRLLL